MLWLALHLPSLSLEAFCAGQGLPPAQPVALLARQRIVQLNPAAQALGLQPGMKRATALGLAPQLQLGQADAGRDARALQAVAHALMAFTPSVVLQPPQAVLAELQASLRCFGGPQALWQRIADALAPLGHQLQWAEAPGASAAALLAVWSPQAAAPVRFTRAVLAPPPVEGQTDSRDPVWAALQQRLGPLPAQALLPGDAAASEALQAMGLETLADLRHQPRAGLGRRFGPGLLQALDRALGWAPDPQQPLQPPWRFADQVELHARSEDAALLLDAARVLLGRMAAWAAARHARVQRFVLGLHHETRLRDSSLGPAGAHRSSLAVSLAEASGDPAHWAAVLRERLQREPLAAPVLSLSLACDEPVLGPPPDAELFPSEAGQREGLLRLLERLQARLGPEGVQRLAPCAEHRPEQATRLQDWGPELAGRRSAVLAPREAPADRPRLTRPVWLLAEPQALPERQSRPWLDGQPLRLLSGPERIEAGWWDGALAARDYFVAQCPAGELVWIYRLRPAPARGEPGWFLHGRFG